MSKKNKGGFILFSQEFKEQQIKKGVTYGNMADLVSAASPHWNLLSEAAKAKYKQNNSGAKYTSSGLSFAEIDRQNNETLKAEEIEAKEVKTIVELGVFDKSIINNVFYIMDVNYFCLTPKGYVIAEFTLLRFNLANGILDHYHEKINPGSIPLGYASDALKECKKLGLEFPFDDENCSNYNQILSVIMDYLNIRNKDSALPPIFTMPDQVAPVKDFILQMCCKASKNEALFRVYKLPQLFFKLVNAFGKHEGLPRESLAINELNVQRFLLIPGEACDVHEAQDKTMHCTLARSKCWMYTILDYCCPIAGIELVPGKHLPKDCNLQAVYEYMDELQNTPRETVAALRNMNLSMDSASSLDNSFTVFTMPVRAHEAVRKPKADFFNLSELSQPTTSIGRGLGRGRQPDYYDKKKPRSTRANN